MKQPTRRHVDARTRGEDGFPYGWVILWLLLALSFWPSLAKAQQVPQAGAIAAPSRSHHPAPVTVEAVETVGLTVSDMDRSIEFYSKVLSFEKVSDT
ncbi:MAG TPA: hypothetical protein VD966_06940, partial [Pyrinomonadaceae bacterium]|nr:hypothetical protein [Pyrinomonadaceae bacterium]